jgi:hypothetical protein
MVSHGQDDEVIPAERARGPRLRHVEDELDHGLRGQ